MPRDVSLSDSKCCENATVGKNGLSRKLQIFSTRIVCNFGDFFVCLQSAGAAGNVAGAATAKEGGASLGPQSDLGTGARGSQNTKTTSPPPPIMASSKTCCSPM